MKHLTAFVAGLLFAFGLGVSRMTDPAVVLAFLDVTGDWDPRLAFVMGGAVLAHLGPTWLGIRRGETLLGERLHLPTRRDIDPRLVGGAAVFGIGWGIAGFCPGPGLVAAAGGAMPGLIFVGGLAIGMVVANLVERARTRRILDPAES